MKRCKSDDFTSVVDTINPTEGRAGDEETPSVFILEVKHGDNPGGNPDLSSTAPSQHTALTRSKPPDLKKIQQLSEGSMFGHGLKHLFHSRRRSREREQQSSQDCGTGASRAGACSDHESADEKERSPEMHRVSYAVSLHDLPARPTAFNRVLQQIRARPSIRRGASLHSSSRRTKSNPAAEGPKGGSPHLARRGAQEASLGLGPQHSRPRSSSTTDTALLTIDPTLQWGPEDPDRAAEKLDKGEMSTLCLPPSAGHTGSDGNISGDAPDAPDPQRTRAALQHLQQKVLKITEQVRVEQEARDENVAEYLKLAHNADKQQAARIKQVFEKKNQKSAQTIAHLHKKLEHYHKKLKEIEQPQTHTNGPSRQPKDVLRDMQQGLKDVRANVRAGISGFGGGVVEGVKGGVSALSHAAVVSKPREFASLIRNKFGSADNIAQLKDTLEDPLPEDTPRALSGSATLVSSPKYGSEDECSSATSGSAAGSNSGAGAAAAGLGGLAPPVSSPKSNALDAHHHHLHGSWDVLLEELRQIKAGQSNLEDDIEDMKSQLHSDYSYMTQCLQEERYRYERLEEQLNDLTELHQNEMSNLKQELASMEEKVAYQSYERARDIQEAVESCLTRITKLELQQQQQQVVQLEGVENANARALLGKFINVILALMAVLLVFVSTLANFITPLMKTRERVAATVLLALVLFCLWKHWDFVEVWLLPS
ncbi:transmembrane and coiled-coil domains protein 2-like isoform X2 [Anguilla rostrata]|uniref:transmembrane and coiled-coil domains protein 2-like isoform X2 n=1 Tax=Anguilla rostrata TaxID=7938 RepID=UPI0030D1438C